MAFIPKYILILGFTIVIDYVAGIMIENSSGKKRKVYLSLSIIANAGVLCVFKYYNFFTANLAVLLNNLHFSYFSLPILTYVLPIGLSFHTFQAMSYTIEVYRGNQKAERHFGIYALYVMFYPQLVAGPIERPQNLLHQFHEKHQFVYSDVVGGLKLVIWGLFKKVVIADTIGNVIGPVFHQPQSFASWNILVAVILFPFQLYCDFSGYSDVAIGTARVMGFKLMKNFNFPYISQNMTEFWRRWHISLSTWLNDYLFSSISIGVRNWGKWAVIFALNVTFLIAGLWHGANWNFIVFGVLNGVALSYEVLSKKFRKKIALVVPAAIYVKTSIVLTFLYWAFCLIFFRSESLSTAIYIVKALPTSIINCPNIVKSIAPVLNNSLNISGLVIAFLLIVMLEYLEHLQRKINLSAFLDLKPIYIRWGIYYFMIISILALLEEGKQSFIYFQF
jgi:D-alanyl-lipoteichoic acid acyltransferase DltB (MBOAT superfamily)